LKETKFTALNFNNNLLDGLSSMGFEKATPIQAQAIPEIAKGNDIIACAQTGTGKTAAFLLPVLDAIGKAPISKHIDALIIAPTRELALQIDQQVDALGYFTGVTSLAIYGGTDGIEFVQQKKALTKGADIIIATPGKLLSHLRLGYVKCNNLKYLILDEADRMLDMGFHDDIMKIISFLPKERQTLLFSATMPSKIRQLSKKLLKPKPVEISIALGKTAEGVLQAAYHVYEKEKIRLIENLLEGKKSYKSILVFASTKSAVKSIAKSLVAKKFAADQIQSDLEQAEREIVLRKFKNRKIQLLVATDIVSRGIDIDDISLIINYNVPAPEDYVHRVGRTARAENTGLAITLIDPDEDYKFKKVEQLIGKEVPKMRLPAGFSEVDLKQKKRSGGGKKWSGNKKGYHKKRR